MMANAADSLSDCLSTAAVLVSTVALFFFPQYPQIDAIMGIIVSVLIFISGIKIFLESMHAILGEAPDPEIVDNIMKITAKYPEAMGTHDMFIHSYGPGKSIVSFHVEVDGSADIFHSHDVIDNIEKEIHETYGYICTIHLDPIVTDDERVTTLRDKVAELVSSIDGSLRIHDFRFVEGKTHTNLIFDVAAPFELGLTDKEIASAVSEKVKSIDKSYFTVITVDRE
jgi:divalent metal cation (Fe/Co/Zn/Cd) transporter